MLVFACISPHPPIILPNVGSEADRKKVKKTIDSLERLGKKMAEVGPDCIVITSPHPDWGFNVPLHFLFPQGVSRIPRRGWNAIDTLGKTIIFPFLTSLDSPKKHFERGKEIIRSLPRAKRGAWIASGDMSHRLKKDGPYGFHPSGPKFDREFIERLKKKDVQGILNLDQTPRTVTRRGSSEVNLVEEAGECGLRSFCMLLGALEEWRSSSAGLKPRLAWQPEILSYECPFGVGYLVANFKLDPKI